MIAAFEPVINKKLFCRARLTDVARRGKIPRSAAARQFTGRWCRSAGGNPEKTILL